MTLVLLCCMVSLTTAQRTTKSYLVSVVVKDSLDKHPLPKASVVIDFGKINFLTNENGELEITLTEGQHNFAVKYVGYRTVRNFFTIQQPNPKIEILLNPLSNELEEVIISSKGSEQSHQRPILGVSVLNIKALKKLPSAIGELDIFRGLQMLPGVTSVGEASNGVNIRGGTTDQNLMLIDDMPIFNPTHMFGLFTAFPAEVMSGVELYKGNAPARFGGRVAAVLDVNIQNPSTDKFKLSGGISPVSNRLVAEIPILKDKMGILLAGRASFNDFLLPIFADNLKDVKANFADAVGKFFWRLNQKHTLTASGYYSYDFFQTKLLGTVGNILASKTQYDYRTKSLSVRWFWGINSTTNLLTTYSQSNYLPQTLLPEINRDNTVRIVSGVSYKSIKSSFSIEKPKHKFELGLSATKYEINPGELLVGSSRAVNEVKLLQEQAIETGIFTEDEVRINEMTTLSIGLRYSYFFNLGPAALRIYDPTQPRDDFAVIRTQQYSKNQPIQHYGGFEPRLGLKHSISKATTLKLGYNLMRQYIQVVTNTTTPLPTSRWKTSDTHIKPQIGSLITAGGVHSFSDDVYELTIEGYYRNTQNIPDYKPGADFLLSQHPETMLLQGVNRSYGFETMLSKKKGEVTGWLSYTYARSQNRVSQGNLFVEQINMGQWYLANYDRPHSFNASVIINQGKHNDFSINFTYSTGRPYSLPNGYVKFEDKIFPFYDFRNNSRIPDYHRLDFAWNIYNASMKEHRWKSHWTVTVYNIYARRNAYSIFFTAKGNGVEAKRLVIFGAPILSLTYNFKFM